MNDTKIEKGEESAEATSYAMRVWHIPQHGHGIKPFHVPVKDLETAMLVIEVLDQYDLYELANRIKGDYFNGTGLEILDKNGNWNDWEGEDGESIDEYMRERHDNMSAREALMWESIR